MPPLAVLLAMVPRSNARRLGLSQAFSLFSIFIALSLPRAYARVDLGCIPFVALIEYFQIPPSQRQAFLHTLAGSVHATEADIEAAILARLSSTQSRLPPAGPSRVSALQTMSPEERTALASSLTPGEFNSLSDPEKNALLASFSRRERNAFHSEMIRQQTLPSARITSIAPGEFPRSTRFPTVQTLIEDLSQSNDAGARGRALVEQLSQEARISRELAEQWVRHAQLQFLDRTMNEYPEALSALIQSNWRQTGAGFQSLLSQTSRSRNLLTRLHRIPRPNTLFGNYNPITKIEAEFTEHVFIVPQNRTGMGAPRVFNEQALVGLERNIASLEVVARDIDEIRAHLHAHQGSLTGSRWRTPSPGANTGEATFRSTLTNDISNQRLGSSNPTYPQDGGRVYQNQPLTTSPYSGATVVPNAPGVTWREADLGFRTHDNRGSDFRILYSNDGRMYFSPDHYQSPAIQLPGWR